MGSLSSTSTLFVCADLEKDVLNVDLLHRLCNSFGTLLSVENRSGQHHITFASSYEADTAHGSLAKAYKEICGVEIRTRPVVMLSRASYTRNCLGETEQRGFASAAMLLWQVVDGKPCILLTNEFRQGKLCLNTLGGKRVGGEVEPVVTALRELWEEAGLGLITGPGVEEGLNSQEWYGKAAAVVLKANREAAAAAAVELVSVPSTRRVWAQEAPTCTDTSRCVMWWGSAKMAAIVQPAACVLQPDTALRLPALLSDARRRLSVPDSVGVDVHGVTDSLAGLSISHGHEAHAHTHAAPVICPDIAASLHWVPLSELVRVSDIRGKRHPATAAVRDIHGKEMHLSTFLMDIVRFDHAMGEWISGLTRKLALTEERSVTVAGQAQTRDVTRKVQRAMPEYAHTGRGRGGRATGRAPQGRAPRLEEQNASAPAVTAPAQVGGAPPPIIRLVPAQAGGAWKSARVQAAQAAQAQAKAE